MRSLCNNFSLSLPLKGKLGSDFSLKGFLMLRRRFLADDHFTYSKIPGRTQSSAMEGCWQLARCYSPFSCPLLLDTTKPHRALISPPPHQFHPQMIWGVVSLSLSPPSIALCCCEAPGPVLRGAVMQCPAGHRPGAQRD